MNPPTTSIDVHDLHKSFGQIQALARVNLQVSTGQIFGLLGPNGAGKTTLIRLLVGSTRPSSGRLSVLGLDPTRQKRALRRLIGYMPQSPALYEDLSAHDNIHFFGRAHQPENLSQRVDEVIEFAQLTARARDPVHTFSGGMKQRVSLACALVHQPQLLLLDEPTSGIDPQLRQAFWDHFRDLTARGVTLVVSTHQMDEALYCDRLAILHQGIVLADDSPRRLLSDSRATIKISCGDEGIEHRVTNYPEHLPRVLQHYGLDPAISRIEVERETLETIVLRMIDDHETHQSALHSMGSEG
jgi:ABC-2 type transport system ATP-binding protein